MVIAVANKAFASSESRTIHHLERTNLVHQAHSPQEQLKSLALHELLIPS